MTLKLQEKGEQVYIDFVLLTLFLFSSCSSLGFKLPCSVTSMYCYCQIYYTCMYYISYKFNYTLQNVSILCNATGFKSVKKVAIVLLQLPLCACADIWFTFWCHSPSAWRKTLLAGLLALNFLHFAYPGTFFFCIHFEILLDVRFLAKFLFSALWMNILSHCLSDEMSADYPI